MVKKTKDIISYLIMVAIISPLLFLGINAHVKKKSLHNNTVYTSAIVTRIYTVRYSSCFDYIFEVDGNVYNGSSAFYPDIAVGDTCFILYDKTDPSNNRTVQNSGLP